jgi:hypothetical protein
MESEAAQIIGAVGQFFVVVTLTYVIFKVGKFVDAMAEMIKKGQ